ncbi:phosphate-starvation-inducible protein PsiE [Psychromonas sp. PT13]|uniref:phosphate-starvation-inducible protein PsiE n=1 Tax=Psychromonas sp. PT13 TaxID=3439547 RepID=UPI003EC10A89
MDSKLKKTAYRTLVYCEDFGLIIVAISTVIALGFEIFSMIGAKAVTLSDLLLMFIYLEVFAMVGTYLKSGKLPVRMPLYIAIVAIARYIILDMKNLDTLRMLGLAGAVLIIALAILAIRFGHCRFPYNHEDID